MSTSTSMDTGTTERLVASDDQLADCAPATAITVYRTNGTNTVNVEAPFRGVNLLEEVVVLVRVLRVRVGDYHMSTSGHQLP